MTTSTDSGAFEAQVRRHTRELHVHCYRMTGSFEESEDLVQETFLRAWRKREQFEGRASLRAWLYGIATNACLDALDKRPRIPTANGEVLWLQPYPDSLLAELPYSEDSPEDAIVAKEILETTVASANSALQRARAGLREHLPERRAEWRPDQERSGAQRELLARFLEASERVDSESMGSLRCVLTQANGQPAVAAYARTPGTDGYRPMALDVLRIEDGLVREIVIFDGQLLKHFDLPAPL